MILKFVVIGNQQGLEITENINERKKNNDVKTDKIKVQRLWGGSIRNNLPKERKLGCLY